MFNFLLWYGIIGAIWASIQAVLISMHPYYQPTILGWIVNLVLWPLSIIQYIGVLTRG